jgi:hypothetical protein
MRQPTQRVLPDFPIWLPRLESKSFTLIPLARDGQPVCVLLAGRRFVFYTVSFHPGESRASVHADVVEDKLRRAGFLYVPLWAMEKLKERFPVPKGFPRIFTFGKGKNRRLSYIVYTSAGWHSGEAYFSQREIGPTDLFLLHDVRPQPNARR